jgi:hypothetical protein
MIILWSFIYTIRRFVLAYLLVNFPTGTVRSAGIGTATFIDSYDSHYWVM